MQALPMEWSDDAYIFVSLELMAQQTRLQYREPALHDRRVGARFCNA